ncbi:MAG TPA: GH92 family glycosyl hydrolase [Bacteroidia bacterium]|jgi:predicted alpha-1,2-mannosidase|nr:GH92 family glycosyl hydrolase [Bacteroidia bacterium]
MRKLIFLAGFFFFALGVRTQDNSQFVKPMVGTGGHGHTFPGAVVPFGMVQLSPDTRNDGSWDGCSGYHHGDSLIYGFSHTHLSGTGCSDYGDILLMPIMKNPTWDRQNYPAYFFHKNEKVSAGYYSVKFNDDPITTELTTTARVGFHKYTFGKGGSASVFLDLTHRDKLLEGEIKIIDNKTIEVFRRSEAWAKDQYVYARIEFSKPFTADKNTEGEKAFFNFTVKKGESILVKVSVSSVDYEGAKKNMEAELPHWDFEKVKKDAAAAWNKELGKIEVKTKSLTDKENFYTALYHCMIHPSLSSDVDMRYRGNDLKIHQGKHDHYTVFSLWDTFRGLHPLFTIIEQKRTNDFINSFLDIYNEFGMMPMWELSGNETYCMIGYHSASVIADALIKGIGNYDTTAVLNALIKSSNIGKFGIKQYAQKGYLSVEDEPESVSKTLEYAYDDWCIAQIAKTLKKQSEYNLYMKRSQSWVNLYDPQTGHMRPRFNGGWYSPFDAKEVNNHFTEANSWQYSFFVPQNIAGLIQESGGEKKFEEKLDLLFTTDSKTSGREQADITGLIGQYAQGNEPSHHMAYLYNSVSAPQKTEKLVNKILHELYKPKPDGLCGNEDCGQMSAWFILSSMGFYPVSPGIPQYAIGTCLFDTVKINLENGKTFTIKTQRQNPGDFYVGSVSLSDNQFQKELTYLHHADIMNGGVFQMNLVSDPSKSDFGKRKNFLGALQKFIPTPVINAEMIFKDSTTIKITTTNVADKIFYSINKEPYKVFEKYFSIANTTNIKAFVVRGKDTSACSEGTFYKMKHPDWKVSYNYKYDKQYSGGGDEALIDGIYGDENWRKGFWQGFQGKDVEITIDMGKTSSIGKFVVSVLQDTRAWIVYPQSVEFFVSTDGKKFQPAANVKNNVSADSLDARIQELSVIPLLPTVARYVKITLKQYGKLPDWHPGKGGNSFIFIGEIDLK